MAILMSMQSNVRELAGDILAIGEKKGCGYMKMGKLMERTPLVRVLSPLTSYVAFPRPCMLTHTCTYVLVTYPPLCSGGV